ncbi:hypothetical protein [Pseudonocardia sp. NPDC046786]|uniref:hypothetical protein n=1 Tax=Pseudonocardia sp. NPDC046786 TaxID=3155471 RepID=UPI0033F32834
MSSIADSVGSTSSRTAKPERVGSSAVSTINRMLIDIETKSSPISAAPAPVDGDPEVGPAIHAADTRPPRPRC